MSVSLILNTSEEVCSMISELFKPKEWFLNLFQKHYYMIFENYNTKYQPKFDKKIVKITNHVSLDIVTRFFSVTIYNETWFVILTIF